jgi:hypothetical protein
LRTSLSYCASCSSSASTRGLIEATKHGTDLVHHQRAAHRHHNPAMPPPNSRLNRNRQCAWDTIQKGWAMTEQTDHLARAREEIAARVASFKATQQKFEREREEFCVTTLENARNGSDGKAFWS